MSMLPVGFGASGDYTIEESLRFNASQSSYLSRTFTTPTDGKRWTWSGWVKRGVLTAGTGTAQQLFSAGTATAFFRFSTTDTLISGWTGASNLETTQRFRDPSAWYHVMLVVDTTQATASNRVKYYVNGVQITAFATTDYPTQNSTTVINSAVVHNIGAYTSSSQYLDGYLTEVNFIDGQALDASSFGETDATTGVWKPKGYTGTYGTNGFYLPMKLDNTTEGFNTVTWVGNDSTQKISGVGFSPDLVWIKNRDNGAAWHTVVDSVRGSDGTSYYRLFTNDTAAEGVNANNSVKSLDTDGFTVVSNSSYEEVNGSGAKYVAWCWDAGNTTVSNTDGSITSSVRANPTYGFSVVSYTGNGSAGATVGHSLGSVPSMVIVKKRSALDSWQVYHASLPSAAYRLVLNDTAAQTSTPTIWNSTAPTSTVFSIGTDSGVNTNTGTYIAYCFSEVSGYSKFGSYTGTGAAGLAVNCGFKPAMVLIKRTDVANTWLLIDSTRDVVNPIGNVLQPNTSDAEIAQNRLDFTDTGFTLQQGGAGWLDQNASGGTYIYMAFKDTREYAFWLDDSGNNNDWQPNGGITTSSTVTDTPTPYLGGGNYAVLNPVFKANSQPTFSNANLTVSPNAATYQNTFSTIVVTSGKWYAEILVTGAPNSGNYIGVSSLSEMNVLVTTADAVGATSTGYSLQLSSGNKYTNGGSSAYGSSYAAGDIVQIALDLDNGKLWFGKNGTWQVSGDPSAGTSPTYSGITGSNGFSLGCTLFNAGVTSLSFNFGQRPFAYTPPTGFKALHTGNLPDSTIVDGSKYFNALLYTGNGSTQSVTGLEFQPDLVWIKDRTNGGVNHGLFDSVRGTGKILVSASTQAELGNTGDLLGAFNSDGFQVNTTFQGGTNPTTNLNGDSFVAWNWKANGTGVSNTDGSITSTVSANPTAGFSIVSYTGNGSTGATVGHGLGVAPDMIIIKNRDTPSAGTPDWQVGHTSMGWNNRMKLQATEAQVSNNIWWNSTAPTSSVMTIDGGGNVDTNDSGKRFIAYCFAEVEGYSRISSFVGNGSTDGPFVYCGFRPKWLLFKNTNNGTRNWYVFDSVRNTYNVVNSYLSPNLSNAEGTLTSPVGIDFTSNGFKVRDSASYINNSGDTMIYMAFAENPFKNSLAR